MRSMHKVLEDVGCMYNLVKTLVLKQADLLFAIVSWFIDSTVVYFNLRKWMKKN